MDKLEKAISSMDFRFFGTGQHKVEIEPFLKRKDAVLLDVRAKEETETIKFQLKYHLNVLEIPINEVPARINEIPKDKLVGIFCSSGVRCTIIFTYLKAKGYEKVKILAGGYAKLIEALLTGKIYNHINN